MSDEIEQRLAAAAQAVREHDLCEQQHALLSTRERAAAEDLDAARQQYAGEEKDVDRLEHLSLTRVAELGGSDPTAPRLEISAGFKFADIFFNNIFTDLAVGRQIRDAQDNVDQSMRQVRALQARLKDQSGTVVKRLDVMNAERQQLLMQ